MRDYEIVDTNADSHRDIFMTEIFHWLENPVLVNLKIFFGESRNRGAVSILNRRMQNHIGNVDADGIRIDRMLLRTR